MSFSRIRKRGRGESARGLPSRAALGLAVAALFAVGATAGQAQSGEAANEFVAHSDPCLNLRPGPSLDDAPVRCLPPGRRMTLLESRGEWGRVRLPDDQVGWVALRLVKPLAEATPAPPPAPPKREPQRPRQPEPPQAEPPRQKPEPARQPEPANTEAQPQGAEPPASLTALAEAEEAARRRVRDLEAALIAADAESKELERALAAVIADDAESTAQAEAKRQEEVDDLTGLLRAAEMFLSESEKQRLELARQVAALQEENRTLRELFGEEPDPEAPGPVASVADVSPDAPSGVLLPEAPIADARRAAADLEGETATPEAPGVDAAEIAPEDAPETSELARTVMAWAKAWSEQRVDDYLSFYSRDFQPSGGMSRAEWEGQRRKRISAPSGIEVKVALRDVRTRSPTRVEIEFLQSYKSDSYSDVVVKTLELVLESEAWKIAREGSS